MLPVLHISLHLHLHLSTLPFTFTPEDGRQGRPQRCSAAASQRHSAAARGRGDVRHTAVLQLYDEPRVQAYKFKALVFIACCLLLGFFCSDCHTNDYQASLVSGGDLRLARAQGVRSRNKAVPLLTIIFRNLLPLSSRSWTVDLN